MISQKIIKVLEFDKVKQAVGMYAALPGSPAKLMEDNPITDFDNCRQFLELTREADITLTDYGVNPIYAYEDVGNALLKAEKQSLLAIYEIVRVGALMRSSRIFKTGMDSLQSDRLRRLKEIASRIYADEWLEGEITRCFPSDDTVSDTATDKLYTIRKKIRQAGEDIKDRLRSIVRGAEYKKYIQDALVTLRSERYVIPVKQEFKNSIPGMLHDRSDTGSTVYIEPAAVVELNNEIKLLQIAERQEIESILKDFTVRICIICEQLAYNMQNLCDADIAFAKAQYAYSTKSVCPVLSSDGYVNIINGRHPLIDPLVIVPVSVSFGKDYNILIITGPNTGGKTVTLKLCGLFSLMAMSGMYVPAGEGTQVSVFDGIYADIGDEQSIEHSLSTFSSHIKNIVNIAENVTRHSLVLLDELGVGTDPAEGSAIALSLLEYLSKTGCRGIVTTHYSEVKEYAFASPVLKNASMEFDPVRLTPTYRLNIGMPGSSSALEISKKLGLRQDIIDQAYSYLTKEKISFDKILKSAEATQLKAHETLQEAEQLRKSLEKQNSALEEEKQRYQKLRETLEKNSKQELKKIYSTAAYRSEELLGQLEEIIKQSELTEYDIVRAKQIKNRLADDYYKYMSDESAKEPDMLSKPLKAEKLQPGIKVFIKSLNAAGVLVRVEKNNRNAVVRVGSAELSVKCADLYQDIAPGGGRQQKPQKPQAAASLARAVPQDVSGEIKLLGKTVMEAEALLSEFLDSCVLSGFKECKVIHGTGTGALRKGVREYLKLHPLVKSFRSGIYGEGESGVTIVEFN